MSNSLDDIPAIPPDLPDSTILTFEEVAGILRMSPNTLRWMRQQGTAPRMERPGRRLLTRAGDLRAWIDRNWRDQGPDAA